MFLYRKEYEQAMAENTVLCDNRDIIHEFGRNRNKDSEKGFGKKDSEEIRRVIMVENIEKLAQEILELTGGKENISLVTHCMTRLRFVVKDESKIKVKEIENLKEVAGCRFSEEQFHVIIGTQVREVYREVCRVGGFPVEKKAETKKPLKDRVLGMLKNK